MIRLVLVLVVTLLSVTQQVSGDRFYITTSPNNPCPERFHATSGSNSCLTLQEYVNGLQRPSSNTVVLELEPGNHNLSSPFSISSNVTSVTLVAANSTATIHCVHYDALSFDAVEIVYISGVNFVKCLANKVESASVFTLEDYSFTTATLSLLNVRNGTITRGSFQENDNVNTSLYTFRSSLLVQDTDFTNNVGYIAGAIQSVESQLTVERCAFMSNSIWSSGSDSLNITNHTAGGETMKACKSAVTLSDDVEGLLTVHTDLDYEENFCILYDTKGPAFQPNQTNDTHIPYVAHENLLIVSEPPDDSSCVANSTTEFDSCLTLQEYAVNGTSKVSSELLMKLAPGNHTISSSLNIRYKSSLTIVGSNANVGCSGRNTIISILQVHTVHISGVTFAALSGNNCEVRIDSVNTLVLSGLKFGVKFWNNNSLWLNNIVSAVISRNSVIGRYGYVVTTWPTHFIVAKSVRQLLVTNCTFFNNYGGCIYSEDSRVTVEHSNFTRAANYPTNEEWGIGAAITAVNGNGHFYLASSLNVTNCTFFDNHAVFGGAVYVRGPDTPVWITQNSFEGCQALLHDGGAVYIKTGKSVWISENTFKFNSAKQGGGAVYCEATKLSIERNSFYLNIARLGDGGAVKALSSLSISRSDFSNNRAGSKGGAVFLNTTSSSVVNVELSSFTNNMLICKQTFSTLANGWIYICGDNQNGTALYFFVVPRSSIVINQSDFVGNTVVNPGIPIVCISGTTNVTYILNNTDMTTETPTTNPPTEVTTLATTRPISTDSTSSSTEENPSAPTEPSTTSAMEPPETIITYPATIPTPRTPSETNSSATELPSAVSSATAAPSETNPSTPEGVPTTAISSTDNATTTSGPVSEVRSTTAGSPATTEVHSGSEANTMASTTPSPNSASKGESSQHKLRLVVIIPTVVVVVLVTLIAALVSVVLLFLCCFARRGPFHRPKRPGQSGSILSESGSYVELLQPESQEDNGQEGGGDDQVEKL